MDDKIKIIDILNILIEGKIIIFSVAGASLLLAILSLVISTPEYTASMILAPSSVSSQDQRGLSELSGIASLVGISLPAEDELSSFTEFQERLDSYQVAEGLAKKPQTLQKIFSQYWNLEAGKWNTRPGMLTAIRYAIGRLFGLPSWSPPDAEDLMHYITDEVSARIDTELALFTIEFDHEDSDFAQKFLQELHEETDRVVRHDALNRTSKQVAYLEEKLAEAVFPEHKRALAELILGQEQKMMMLEIDLPYAARVISAARVSSEPTSPRPIILALISLISGLLLGIFLVFFLNFLHDFKNKIMK